MPMSVVPRRSCLRLLACGIACAGSGHRLAHAADFCDPLLPRLADNPHSYRMRGSRCEGVFVREVSGDELRLASFTRWFADFDATDGRALTLRWRAPRGDGRLQLRAQGLARRSYYRMDAVCEMGRGEWSWPTDLLAARGLRRADIGVMASTRADIAGTEREVWVPLQIGPRPAGELPRRLELVVLPQLELKQLFIRVDALTVDGRTRGATPSTAIEAGQGIYPAERPVVLSVEPTEVGMHRGELGAVFKQGGSATLAFWFHHSGW